MKSKSFLFGFAARLMPLHVSFLLSSTLITSAYLIQDAHASNPTCAEFTDDKSDQSSLNPPYVAFTAQNREEARRFGPLTYDRLVQAALEEHTENLPHFINFVEDEKARNDRRPGTQGPPLLADLLPPGIEYLDAPVKDPNEPGVIKLGDRDFVSLRAKVQFQGKTIETNIGTMHQALLQNFGKRKKLLVPKGILAVLVLRHGGATDGAGHHIAADLAKSLWDGIAPADKILVVSYDSPNHAAGPLGLTNAEGKTSARAEIEFGIELIRQHIIPSGVPIFVTGHSMGGTVTMAEYTHFNELIREDERHLFKGFISQSPVVDPNTYYSFDPRYHMSIISHDLAPTDQSGDWNTHVQNKVKPICDAGCAPLIKGISLDGFIGALKAQSQSTSPIPFLALVGKGDLMFVPSLTEWDKLRKALGDHLIEYGARTTFDSQRLFGDEQVVGHQIMNHFPKLEINYEKTHKDRNISEIIARLFYNKPWGIDDFRYILEKWWVGPEKLREPLLQIFERETQEMPSSGLSKLISSQAELINQLRDPKLELNPRQFLDIIEPFIKKDAKVLYRLRDPIKLILIEEGIVERPAQIRHLSDFSEFEALLHIRNFIYDQMGRPVPVADYKENPTEIDRIALEYMRNLAFRVFLKNYWSYHFIPTEELAFASEKLAPSIEKVRPFIYQQSNNFNWTVLNTLRKNLQQNTEKSPFEGTKIDPQQLTLQIDRLSTAYEEGISALQTWADHPILAIYSDSKAALQHRRENLENAKAKFTLLKQQIQNPATTNPTDMMSNLASLIELRPNLEAEFNASREELGRFIRKDSQSYPNIIADSEKNYLQELFTRKQALSDRQKSLLNQKDELAKELQERLYRQIKTTFNELFNSVDQEYWSTYKPLRDLHQARSQKYQFYTQVYANRMKTFINKHHIGNGEFDIDIFRELPPEIAELQNKLGQLGYRITEAEEKAKQEIPYAALEGHFGYNKNLFLAQTWHRLKSEALEKRAHYKRVIAELFDISNQIESIEVERFRIFKQYSPYTLEFINAENVLNNVPRIVDESDDDSSLRIGTTGRSSKASIMLWTAWTRISETRLPLEMEGD